MKIYLKFTFVISFVLFSQILFAGSEKTGNPERKKSDSSAMSESVYKKFVKLQEMIADEMYVESRKGLEALDANKRLNNSEVAQVNQYLGWIESIEGNYDAAAARFQRALDSDSLANQAHFGMMLQIAQMYVSAGKFEKGIEALKKYYRVTDEIKDTTFALEANAYAQLEQPAKAIPVLKKAISLSDKPKETWHYLLYSLHMQLSQFQEAAVVLKTLIEINPNKKDYWNRLSGVYFNLKKDAESLAVLVVAKENGLVETEKDKLHLFKMYTFLDIPFEAGKVLEKGLKDGSIESNFKHWDDLGKTWYSAAEMDRSLAAYQEASKLATDGKVDFQLAYIYFDREDWTSAKNSLTKALEKGGLKDRQIGKSWLLLGMAESESGSNSRAVKAFQEAKNFKDSRNNAVQWLNHLAAQAKQARINAEREKLFAEEQDNNNITEQ